MMCGTIIGMVITPLTIFPMAIGGTITPITAIMAMTGTTGATEGATIVITTMMVTAIVGDTGGTVKTAVTHGVIVVMGTTKAAGAGMFAVTTVDRQDDMLICRLQ